MVWDFNAFVLANGIIVLSSILQMATGVSVGTLIVPFLAMLYTIFSVVMLFIFYLFGQFSYEQFVSGVMMMPGFLIGYMAAPRFARYFDPKYAKTAVLAMAIIGSTILIGKSLSMIA